MAKQAKKSKASKRTKRAAKGAGKPPAQKSGAGSAKRRRAAPAYRTGRPARRSGGPATPLPEEQLEKFREVLTQKRDDLLAVVQRKKVEEVEDMEVGDEADVATRSVEKEMLFELTDSEKQTLDMVEAALRKMEKGVYGFCESCRKGIPRMRLQVMPWARYCVDCQTQQEIPAAE